MLTKKRLYTLLAYSSALLVLFLSSCSTKKNTTLSRTYHSINTRYNIHFNANEAYKEALKAKIEGEEDNLSDMIYIYPYDPEALEKQTSSTERTAEPTYGQSGKNTASSAASSLLGNSSQPLTMNSLWGSEDESFGSSSAGGGFTTSVDKLTKAIKLHSIKTRPRQDRSKRKDEKYQAWLKQKEFNPFMKNVWLLLGKSELENKNYLQAISTFMYTMKVYSANPEIHIECQLGIARAYTEMGWMYEAANVLHKISFVESVPNNLKGQYASVHANYYMRSEEYGKAIPYMTDAIKKEKNGHQKLRMKFMLGQLYLKNGDRKNALLAFKKVQGLTTPHKFLVNARLNELALDDAKPRGKVISDLKSMTKGVKNEDYLDQVYYTIGNVYMLQLDSMKAIENYKLAVEKSKRNAYDKALAQIALGDIFFETREYVDAQPCYSDALSALKKTDKAYPHVYLRSGVLDELVVHVKTVHEQDSLQHLAQLPEAERLQIINDKIEALKKEEKEKEKEKEEKREQRREEYEQNKKEDLSWDDLGDMFDTPTPERPQQPFQPPTSTGGDNATIFYFYNEQTVAQGKVAFQKQWGARKLEDNWRRKSKAVTKSDDFLWGSDEKESDEDVPGKKEPEGGGGAQNEGASTEMVNDVYSVDYYLQQLPLTVEAIIQSDVLIENALFHMGGIYKDKLVDFNLAIDAFTTDLTRFPETPNAEEIYYQLFLMYMQMDNRNSMTVYRSKLLNEFGKGRYATALSDPNYEWNLKHMHILQDSLYEATYEAYLDNNIDEVRDNYESLQAKYPFANLMPKFMFLNALTYAQTRDVVNLKSNLEELTKEYPTADVTTLGNEILERIKDGKILLSDGTPIRGMDWNIPFEDDALNVNDSLLQFVDSVNSEHMLLLFYKTKTIDRNKLLYNVADYNFSNYLVQTFDLNFQEDPPLEMLQIKGFRTFANIRSYVNRAFGEKGLVRELDPAILMIPISVENSKLLLKRGIDEYISFFGETYGNQMPNLVAYWKGEAIRLDFETDVEDEIIVVEDKEEKVSTIAPKEEVEEKEPITVPTEQEPKKEDKDGEHSETIKASDVLNDEQMGVVNAVSGAVDAAGDIMNNPVDGVKNLFNKYKNRQKLTKEEKEELKEEKRLEKERQKELRVIEKARQDSVTSVERAVQDSIKLVEKQRQDEVKRAEQEKDRIEKEKKDAVKAKERAKEEARKEKEQARKDKQREQEDRRKTQEKERNERRKAQEKERDDRKKLQEQERKEKEKTANSKRNQRSARR